MTSTPIDIKLYNKVKSDAKKKFKIWPSAYASGWLVKEYKRRGGRYKGKKDKNSKLSQWFLEKWVNICSSPMKKCGRPTTTISNWKKDYPYCRPSKRINKSTPKTVNELSKSDIRKRCSQKRKSLD